MGQRPDQGHSHRLTSGGKAEAAPTLELPGRGRDMRVAAIQLQTVIGDIDANLAACEQLADRPLMKAPSGLSYPSFLPPVSHSYLNWRTAHCRRMVPPQPCYPV